MGDWPISRTSLRRLHSHPNASRLLDPETLRQVITATAEIVVDGACRRSGVNSNLDQAGRVPRTHAIIRLWIDGHRITVRRRLPRASIHRQSDRQGLD